MSPGARSEDGVATPRPWRVSVVGVPVVATGLDSLTLLGLTTLLLLTPSPALAGLPELSGVTVARGATSEVAWAHSVPPSDTEACLTNDWAALVDCSGTGLAPPPIVNDTELLVGGSSPPRNQTPKVTRKALAATAPNAAARRSRRGRRARTGGAVAAKTGKLWSSLTGARSGGALERARGRGRPETKVVSSSVEASDGEESRHDPIPPPEAPIKPRRARSLGPM